MKREKKWGRTNTNDTHPGRIIVPDGIYSVGDKNKSYGSLFSIYAALYPLFEEAAQSVNHQNVQYIFQCSLLSVSLADRFLMSVYTTVSLRTPVSIFLTSFVNIRWDVRPSPNCFYLLRSQSVRLFLPHLLICHRRID